MTSTLFGTSFGIATATNAGMVSTTTQTFAGDKTFTGSVLASNGGASGGAPISSRFNAANAPVALNYFLSNGNPYVGFNTVQSAGDTQTLATANVAARTVALTNGGATAWQLDVAASGAAGSAITWISAMTVTPAGAVTFPVSVTLGTAGGGYTPTALSKYQEGTWTPTIIASGTAGTPTYSTQTGYFTRVGNVVTLTCYLGVSSWAGSPTGNMSIGGIPFSVANQVGNYSYVLIEGASLTIPANTVGMAYTAPNGSVVNLGSFTLGGNAASGLSVDTAFTVYFTITYRCAP